MTIRAQQQLSVDQVRVVDELLAAEKALARWREALDAYETLTTLSRISGAGDYDNWKVARGRNLGRVIQAIAVAEGALFDAMNHAESYAGEIDPIGGECLRRRAQERVNAGR